MTATSSLRTPPAMATAPRLGDSPRRRYEPADLAADIVASPIGPLLLAVDGGGALLRLEFLDDTTVDDAVARLAVVDADGTRVLLVDGLGAVSLDPARVAGVAAHLAAYFAGPADVGELAVAPRGTPFQLAVWRVLREIPAGSTLTYSEVARRIGRPGSVRAVGGAVGSNPIAVVIPCHRVVGADGSITGFGGGLERKRCLLEMEGLSVAAEPATPLTRRTRVLRPAQGQLALPD